MIRTGPWENERLAKVVENYRFHLSRTGAADRMVADTGVRLARENWQGVQPVGHTYLQRPEVRQYDCGREEVRGVRLQV